MQRAVVTNGPPTVVASCADSLRGAPSSHGNVAADRYITVTTDETRRRLATQWVIDISVHFVQRIPIRLTKLLSVGLEVSRSEVQRLVAEGDLSSKHRLTGKSSSNFSFTLHR